MIKTYLFSSENIDFLLDICHGQSGSPIWINWKGFRAIVGIVTIQNDLYKGAKVNSGVPNESHRNCKYSKMDCSLIIFLVFIILILNLVLPEFKTLGNHFYYLFSTFKAGIGNETSEIMEL